MSDRTILRIQKELYDIQKSPDHQIHLWYDEKSIKHVHALILGPPQTPYALGMFDFVFNMTNDYPQGPPKVTAMTTSNGRVRFNPNIYASGKVCLSILGTWEARKDGEKWSAAHGILSVLISIQSLLSDKPYQNEPGHEDEKDEKVLGDYNQKIMHETLRVSVCDRLEETLGWKNNAIKLDGDTLIPRHFCTCREQSPFAGLAKRMFLMYFDNYMAIVEKESESVKDGTPFEKTRFEFGNNSMEGSFQYAEIRKRLEAIQEALLNEPNKWISESQEWLQSETLTSSNLRSQFDQIRASGVYDSSLLMELEDDNPFTWSVTVIGQPMSQHDGGMFRAQLRFHNRFPDEVAPRIRFLSEVFHPQITKHGVPYIRVSRPEDVRQYLDALIKLFAEEPLGDPTTHLNNKAAAMYFGTKEERRDYNRNVRRCAQRSVEY